MFLGKRVNECDTKCVDLHIFNLTLKLLQQQFKSWDNYPIVALNNQTISFLQHLKKGLWRRIPTSRASVPIHSWSPQSDRCWALMNDPLPAASHLLSPVMNIAIGLQLRTQRVLCMQLDVSFMDNGGKLRKLLILNLKYLFTCVDNLFPTSTNAR